LEKSQECFLLARGKRRQGFFRNLMRRGYEMPYKLPPFRGQVYEEPPPVGRVGAGSCELAAHKPVHYTFDRRRVHGGVPAEKVLRAGARFEKLREGCPLHWCQIVPHAIGENQRMALLNLTQNKADLILKHIAGIRSRSLGF